MDLVVGLSVNSRQFLQPLRKGFIHLEELTIIQRDGMKGLSIREIRVFFLQASLPGLKKVRLECHGNHTNPELKNTELGNLSVTHYSGSLYFLDLFPEVEVSFAKDLKV